MAFGGVACESKACSQIGINLLAHGGNAVDAWVGTQLCVGVIGMQHSGLGGGGFSLIRDQSGNYTVIDYREAAPAAAFQDMYLGNERGSVFSGLAAAVPGELRGLEIAHQKFGRLPWRSVVHPAANVARHGFEVTEDLVRYMDYAINFAKWNFLVEDPSWAIDFAPSGKLVKFGDVMTRKRYADVLDAVADGGAEVFYTGPIANYTIAALQADNGTMTLEDMENYEAIVRQPINITYRGYKLFSSGAPSSGAVCLSTLKTMETFPTDDTPKSNLTLHRFVESMRFAYGAHQQLADPRFVQDVDLLETVMLSDSGAAATRAHIFDNTTQPVGHYLAQPYYTQPSHGTSHIVAVDASGMAVSSTTTVNTLFGNIVMVPETGIILNNQMNDFSIPGKSNEFGYAPAPVNFIRPGKRPLSSITPVIVEHPNGTLYVSVGAAGGSRIISSTTQVVWHILEQGMNMTTAIREPRFHDQLMPNLLAVEYSFDNASTASMLERNHNVTWVREGVSAVQGVLITSDTFEAVGEPRQKNSGGLAL
ncbi:gamma-glutamyltranspeptidase [Truncatella angustata]|uniref:Gamma-glutamyltranspeptidase n=1 Tax=Truncatella angustata TaxID=152316 RepID=A0A9P8ZU50_9PEZI|nr:gamma-glutamyltranspeptidase [Truncatella angustata]KAH6651569.1 gamma-glutamyltranspeptidase [Truncatella angustata]